MTINCIRCFHNTVIICQTSIACAILIVVLWPQHLQVNQSLYEEQSGVSCPPSQEELIASYLQSKAKTGYISIFCSPPLSTPAQRLNRTAVLLNANQSLDNFPDTEHLLICLQTTPKNSDRCTCTHRFWLACICFLSLLTIICGITWLLNHCARVNALESSNISFDDQMMEECSVFLSVACYNLLVSLIWLAVGLLFLYCLINNWPYKFETADGNVLPYFHTPLSYTIIVHLCLTYSALFVLHLILECCLIALAAIESENDHHYCNAVKKAGDKQKAGVKLLPLTSSLTSAPVPLSASLPSSEPKPLSTSPPSVVNVTLNSSINVLSDTDTDPSTKMKTPSKVLRDLVNRVCTSQLAKFGLQQKVVDASEVNKQERRIANTFGQTQHPMPVNNNNFPLATADQATNRVQFANSESLEKSMVDPICVYPSNVSQLSQDTLFPEMGLRSVEPTRPQDQLPHKLTSLNTSCMNREVPVFESQDGKTTNASPGGSVSQNPSLRYKFQKPKYPDSSIRSIQSRSPKMKISPSSRVKSANVSSSVPEPSVPSSTQNAYDYGNRQMHWTTSPYSPGGP